MQGCMSEGISMIKEWDTVGSDFVRLYVRSLGSAQLRSETQQAAILHEVVHQELDISTIKEWDMVSCDFVEICMLGARDLHD